MRASLIAHGICVKCGRRQFIDAETRICIPKAPFKDGPKTLSEIGRKGQRAMARRVIKSMGQKTGSRRKGGGLT